MTGALKVVATVASEAEAELVCGRLSEAGIPAVVQRAIGSAEWGSSGGRYVYVGEADAERASELLTSEVGSISEDELARLSEEAGRKASEP
jgi:putative signal transducing protein